MQSLRFLPSLVIPGLMLLAGAAFLIFAYLGIPVERLIEFLDRRNNLLLYISLAAVAIAYVTSAATNRIMVRLFHRQNEHDFDREALLLKYGGPVLIRSLDATYSVMLLFRLLCGALTLSLAGLLIWLNRWTFWPSLLLLAATASFPVSLALYNSNRRRLILVLAAGFQVLFWLWLRVCNEWEIPSSNYAASVIGLVFVLVPPLFWWLHYLTREDHDKKREAYLTICGERRQESEEE